MYLEYTYGKTPKGEYVSKDKSLEIFLMNMYKIIFIA